MFARIERGWSIAVATFAVLSRYPKLLILPGISFVLLMGAMAAIGTLVALHPKLFGVLFPGSGISARWIAITCAASRIMARAAGRPYPGATRRFSAAHEKPQKF